MITKYAGMAELADAIDSGSIGRKAVQVQVLLPAPCGVSIKDFRFFMDTPFFHALLCGVSDHYTLAGLYLHIRHRKFQNVGDLDSTDTMIMNGQSLPMFSIYLFSVGHLNALD